MKNNQKGNVTGSDALQIRPIQDLSVFDVVVTERSAWTMLSLDIGGKNIYGISVAGTPKLGSGLNTVGAFRDDQVDSIVAWLDPVSKEYVRRTDFGYAPGKLPAVIFWILLAFAVGLLYAKFSDASYAPMIIPALILMALCAALALTINRTLLDRKMETQLRSGLTLHEVLAATTSPSESVEKSRALQSVASKENEAVDSLH